MRGLEWYVARRYLASRRKGRFLSLITWIAVGGVFVGVAALITVIAVMTGLQRDLRAKILGNNPHIYVFDNDTAKLRLRVTDWPAVVERVRGVPGVVTAAPFIMTQVAVVAGEYGRTGMLYGVDVQTEHAPLTEVDAKLLVGELAFGPTLSGLPGIILGQQLAVDLGAYPGMLLTLYSIENIKVSGTGDILPPTAHQFEVTGIHNAGMYEYDMQNMYASFDVVREILELDPNQSGGVAVNVADPWAASQIAAQVSTELGDGYWTEDWIRLNGSLFSALKLEKIAMGVILFLIVIVAAFNIVSTLIMVVADRTREIGILKSMGMTSARILRIFVLQGLAIGTIGTVLGAAAGIGLVTLLGRYRFIELPADVYFLDSLPVALEPLDLTLILLLSILISFAATIYPALQASRLLPVEAIRHD